MTVTVNLCLFSGKPALTQHILATWIPEMVNRNLGVARNPKPMPPPMAYTLVAYPLLRGASHSHGPSILPFVLIVDPFVATQ